MTCYSIQSLKLLYLNAPLLRLYPFQPLAVINTTVFYYNLNTLPLLPTSSLPLSFLLSSTPTAPLSLVPPFLAAASTRGRAPAAQIW